MSDNRRNYKIKNESLLSPADFIILLFKINKKLKKIERKCLLFCFSLCLVLYVMCKIVIFCANF